MMTGMTVTASLSPREFKLIEELVEKGEFNNRSDAIRTMIREWADRYRKENVICNTDTKQ